MSCRTFARPAPLLLKNPEIPDVLVHPVPGTVLKIPGAPDHCSVLTDNQAKLRSPWSSSIKTFRYCAATASACLRVKGAVRQSLKYSEIFAHPHLSGDAPHWTGRLSLSFVRTECRHRSHTRVQTAAEAPAARPYVHGLSFSRLLFSVPAVIPAEADR